MSMFISRFGVQVGDVVEDRRGREWVVIGYYHDCGGNCQIHLLVRRTKRFKMFTVVRALADGQFDEFQKGWKI